MSSRLRFACSHCSVRSSGSRRFTSAGRSASPHICPLQQRGRLLPEHVTATSLLDRLLHHAIVVVTDGESFRMRGGLHRSSKESIMN
jgi:hypothetical protein